MTVLTAIMMLLAIVRAVEDFRWIGKCYLASIPIDSNSPHSSSILHRSQLNQRWSLFQRCSLHYDYKTWPQISPAAVPSCSWHAFVDNHERTGLTRMPAPGILHLAQSKLARNNAFVPSSYPSNNVTRLSTAQLSLCWFSMLSYEANLNSF